MFIAKLNSNRVFRYPFDSGKKWRWQNILKETKLHFFCLATADSISVSVCILLLKNSKLNQRKQSLKQHKTAWRYRSAHANDLEVKTCEKNIFCNVFLSNILCEKLQCKLPSPHYQAILDEIYFYLVRIFRTFSLKNSFLS